MKILIIAISFIMALPFVIAGFVWNFITYSFNKGKEVCENYFEYLDRS